MKYVFSHSLPLKSEQAEERMNKQSRKVQDEMKYNHK